MDWLDTVPRVRVKPVRGFRILVDWLDTVRRVRVRPVQRCLTPAEEAWSAAPTDDRPLCGSRRMQTPLELTIPLVEGVAGLAWELTRGTRKDGVLVNPLRRKRLLKHHTFHSPGG